MAKIVINKCFGGFGLSSEALLELAKRGSKAIKLVHPKDYFSANKNGGWKKAFEENQKNGLVKYTIYEDKIVIFNNYDDAKARADHVLIEVVKELGERADGNYAKLKIVEIPDGIDFEIDEYDGKESISEKHRSWG